MAIEIANPQTSTQPVSNRRAAWPAMLMGARHKCPRCGEGRLYQSYLKVADNCGHCGEELHHHRADDAPPYFTIFIVGHFILGGVLSLEQAYKPSAWFHIMLWMPLTIVSCLVLLPRIKGALVGLQWALGMHGFAQSANRENDAVGSEPTAKTGPQVG